MKNKKGFYAELTGAKKKVIYLQAYFYQGGKWHKVRKVKGL